MYNPAGHDFLGTGSVLQTAITRHVIAASSRCGRKLKYSMVRFNRQSVCICGLMFSFNVGGERGKMLYKLLVLFGPATGLKISLSLLNHDGGVCYREIVEYLIIRKG